LKSGVANAVASLQSLVIAGKIESIAMDSETFGMFSSFLYQTTVSLTDDQVGNIHSFLAYEILEV
jgi:hypothetical protein